jgi:serine/threonine protein kinase
MNSSENDTIKLRNKLIESSVASGRTEKYNSGPQGTLNLFEKFRKGEKGYTLVENPAVFTDGAQAEITRVFMKTDSMKTEGNDEAIKLVIKKDCGNSSVDREAKIGESIKGCKNYEKVRPLLNLSVYNRPRASGNELIMFEKENTLNNAIPFLNKNYHSPNEYESYQSVRYIVKQQKRMAELNLFMNENEFKDENGITRKGIFHGDIKPDNLTLNKKTADICLIDWGSGGFRGLPIGQTGHLAYQPPELLIRAEKYHQGVVDSELENLDTWGIAVIGYEIVNTRPVIAPSFVNEGQLEIEDPSKMETNASGYAIQGAAQKNSCSSNLFFESALTRKELAIEWELSYDKVSSQESQKIIENLPKNPQNLSPKELYGHFIKATVVPLDIRWDGKKLSQSLDGFSEFLDSCSDKTKKEQEDVKFEKKLLEAASKKREEKMLENVKKRNPLAKKHEYVNALEKTSMDYEYNKTVHYLPLNPMETASKKADEATGTSTSKNAHELPKKSSGLTKREIKNISMGMFTNEHMASNPMETASKKVGEAAGTSSSKNAHELPNNPSGLTQREIKNRIAGMFTNKPMAANFSTRTQKNEERKNQEKANLLSK